MGSFRMPLLDEINADPEFEGVAMTPEAFEILWLQARVARRGIDAWRERRQFGDSAFPAAPASPVDFPPRPFLPGRRGGNRTWLKRRRRQNKV
ncbi:hypothetical protein ACU4GD_05210 [Cupriavidus basilensis]